MALTAPGAAALAPVQASHVHRDRRDLVSGALGEAVSGSEDSLDHLESLSNPSIEPYVEACGESHRIFCRSLDAARSGRSANHKPFSQRLVKGAVLAAAAGAVVRVGTVTDALAEVYAQRFGNALRHMQGAEVLVAGRDISDFGTRPHGTRVLSSFVTGRPDGTVLDVPRVCFRAAEI